MPLMTEAVARQVLLRFVSLQCCYGSRAAWELAIQRLRQAGTYRLPPDPASWAPPGRGWDSFQSHTVPGAGQHPRTTSSKVDKMLSPPAEPRAAGPPGDTPMVLWDMEVGPPLLFQGWTQWCRVPRSALVRDCHRCHGHGRSKCRVCHGTSRTRCVTCKGSQRRLKQQKRCQLCSSTGHKRCNTCSGQHSKTCATCQGEKKLQHFKHLAITWKNNVFEFVSEHHLNFPGELLSKVSGESIFKDEKVIMSATPRQHKPLSGEARHYFGRFYTLQGWDGHAFVTLTLVYPIIDFPEPEISLASQRAIAEHSAVLPASSRILWLHQPIELIPITEVHYQYSGKPYLYYIYGLENKVYALDYPERCCCSCTII
ncbi:protein SSUH2 homolog [Ara ararauna]